MHRPMSAAVPHTCGGDGPVPAEVMLGLGDCSLGPRGWSPHHRKQLQGPRLLPRGYDPPASVISLSLASCSPWMRGWPQPGDAVLEESELPPYPRG